MVSSGTLQWVERPQPVEIPKKFAKALSTSPKTSPQQSQSYQSASVCVLLSPSSLQGIKLEFSTPTWNNQYQPGHPRPKSDCWSSQLLLWIKSLDPKGENGRKVDQIGQASHLIGSNALLTIWPKKNSQKWSYSQIHDPLQGSKHFWTKNPHLKEFLKHFYSDLFVSFMDQGWAAAPKICFMVVFTHPSSLGSSVIRNMTW